MVYQMLKMANYYSFKSVPSMQMLVHFSECKSMVPLKLLGVFRYIKFSMCVSGFQDQVHVDNNQYL